MWSAGEREAQLLVRLRGPLPGRHHEMAALEQPENPAGTCQHRSRQPRKTPDLDPVRAIRSTWSEPMEEQHLASDIANVHGVVADSSELISELGELVIMRREDGLATHHIVKVLAHRPCDGHPVVRR